jgi:hypothetical protein
MRSVVEGLLGLSVRITLPAKGRVFVCAGGSSERKPNSQDHPPLDGEGGEG